MSSTIKKQLQEAERLLIHGEFQEGLTLIEKNLKKKVISKEEKLGFLVLKCTIQNYLGKHDEALGLAEKVLEESVETESILLHVDALIQKGMALFSLYEKYDDAINSIDKGFELLETTKLVIPKEELTKRKALLSLVKGTILMVSGRTKESHKFLEESVTTIKECGDQFIRAWVLLWVGFLTKNKNYAEEAHEIATDLGNKLLLAISNHSLAVFLFFKHDYYEAIELIEKTYQLLDEVGSTLHKEMSYNNLGLCYRATYQIDKALEYFQRALKGSRLQRYLVLSNIGYTYLLKNEIEEAQKYYLEALEKSEEVKEFRSYPGILYQLISISIELKEFTNAQKHLDHLKQVSQETNIETINENYRFASILLLKASGEISVLAEAIKLLKEALAKDDLDPHWRLQALYSLLEIRIKELQMSATKEALAEVKKQAIRLEVEAEERQYQWLLGNVYRLQSQLALIDVDSETALALLKKAETIAVESKNEFLKEKVNGDREKFNQQIDMLQKLQERKAPISDTIKLASLENTMQKMKEETVLEERDEETGKIIEYRKLFALKI